MATVSANTLRTLAAVATEQIAELDNIAHRQLATDHMIAPGHLRKPSVARMLAALGLQLGNICPEQAIQQLGISEKLQDTHLRTHAGPWEWIREQVVAGLPMELGKGNLGAQISALGPLAMVASNTPAITTLTQPDKQPSRALPLPALPDLPCTVQ